MCWLHHFVEEELKRNLKIYTSNVVDANLSTTFDVYICRVVMIIAWGVEQLLLSNEITSTARIPFSACFGYFSYSSRLAFSNSIKSNNMEEYNINQPTEAELEILQILWEHQPASVRLVHEKISTRREVGYTTILKQMQRMFDSHLPAKQISSLKNDT